MGFEAIDLYRKMPENLRDSMTHVCVLSACSHAGLVDQGRSIFSQIEQKSAQVITTMVGCFFVDLWINRSDLLDDSGRLSLSCLSVRRSTNVGR